MQASELGKLLTSGIPISEEMGIRDFKLENNKFSFTMPLKNNVNHKGTLFGGSLYSSGALACYGLFLSGLREQGISTNDIVISRGEMTYVNPVTTDAVVFAQWNSQEEKDQFFKTLKSKGKARVVMTAQVQIGTQICAKFSGHFVAITKN